MNVEQDIQRAEVAAGYVLTAQARRSLQRILDGTHGKALTRAWTLTGPFGSGKSYFGLFLMNLMSSNLSAHHMANKQLQEVDPLLAEKACAAAHLPSTRGFLPVPVTGYRGPLQECIKQGLQHALAPLEHEPQVRRVLDDASVWGNGQNSRAVVTGLRNLLDALGSAHLGYSGVLLALDEMGKPLEHAAAHPDDGDIYLLQEIAELANRSKELPLVFVGMLHQGFERYGGHLDGVTQREWSKIQGRFEDIAFQEPPAQQLRLLASAIEHVPNPQLETIRLEIQNDALQVAESGWCPPNMRPAEFQALAVASYPLHSTVMAALPFVFRRLAQNERSMFAYLASLEPKGFQDFLQSHCLPEYVRLPDLFDYLVANYQGRLYATLRARPLTETIERLQSAPLLEPLATDLLKTIGLLNWLADVGHFQGTAESITSALRSPERTAEQISDALRQLQKQSLIVFRRFNRTYAIWQGSDVDLDERVEEAQNRLLLQFSVAQAVQTYLPPRPLVARRHSYETGTTRYFEVRYVDALTRSQTVLAPAGGASGLVLICLAATKAEVHSFTAWAHEGQFAARPDVVIGVTRELPRLAELLGELRSLHWVRDNTPELRDDAVARRELRTRMNDLEILIRHELDQTLRLDRLASQGGCRWFTVGGEIDRDAQRSLTHLLSHVCDGLFPASPRIWNEILNRRALSSQGAAARRNLIEAMLMRAEQPSLGIEGFPPERSMVESVLKNGHLHVELEAGTWGFRAPDAANDPLRLWPVWVAMERFVFALPPEPRSVQALFDQLGSPPYGVTDGVAPVLLCAFLRVHTDDATLYREGTLLPEPGVADWEVLLRRPELFAVAGCRVDGPRAQVVERLASGLRTAPAAVPIVRELLRRLKALPEHAWKTQRLAAPTLAVRRAVEQARSPENLLFHDLPVALGLAPLGDEEIADETITVFFERLNAALQELAASTPSLIAQARDELLAACGLPPGEEGWQQFATASAALAGQVTQPSLAPLLRRAADNGVLHVVQESTLAYVANRPPRSWTDGDTDRFRAQAQALGALFQAERSGRDPAASLTPHQQERSTRAAARLRSVLAEFGDDPQVLQAALQTLLNDLRTANPPSEP